MGAVVLAWGMGPPISKLITAPALVTAFSRLWLSVPLLLGWMYATDRRLSWRLLRLTAPAGVLFGLNMCLVFSAFHHASIATLSVVGALQPGIVLLAAGPLLGERATWWHRSWTAVGVGGAVFVVLGAGSAMRTSSVGIVLSVGSMVSFTAYFLLTRIARARATEPIDAISWMAGVTIFSAITVTPLLLLTEPLSGFGQIDGRDWLWLAWVIIVTGMVGHVLMAWVLRHINASKASLYLLSMNVVAVLAAWPIHNEPLTAVQILGGMVVLGAVAAVVSRPATKVVPAVSTVSDEIEGLPVSDGSAGAAHARQ